MTIGLFRFPFLVYKSIVQMLDLPATFCLSVTSNKTFAIMQFCLRKQGCKLEYNVGNTFTVVQNIPMHTTLFESEIFFIQRDPSPYQYWKLSSQEVVRVRLVKRDDQQTTFRLFWSHNKWRVMNAMILHFKSLFPKLSLDLTASTIECLRNTLPLVRDVDLKCVSVWPGSSDGNDMIKMVLDECRHARTIIIIGGTPRDFTYETQPPSFKCDRLRLQRAGWITKDHIINLWLTCKSLELVEKSFQDEDLCSIFEKWLEDAPMDHMIIWGVGDSYRGSSLTNVVGQLPGAQIVRKAGLRNWCRELEVTGFREGRCYQIQQRSGKKALVYQYNNFVKLTIDFEVGEAVDRMRVEAEEWEEAG